MVGPCVAARGCAWGMLGRIGCCGGERVDLTCEMGLAAGYHSPSQQARVLSEGWFARNAYCLACDADEVKATRANTAATDFICPKCQHRYELKTFLRRPRKSLVDGAYETMMRRMRSGTAPTLCLLERSEDWAIRSLTAIHASFLVPEVVERREPLGPTARRAGWIGCNIRLDRIASDGEVPVVEESRELPVRDVRRRFQRFLPLLKRRVDGRGWTTLTLAMVRRLKKPSFKLAEMYAMEGEFAMVYPENRHVRDKIRQQLQVLRDLELVEFLGGGEYRVRGLS